jgi:hypothetical protein
MAQRMDWATSLTKLFLDDERNPEDVFWISLPEGPYVIVRSFEEFSKYIMEQGIPSFITFDNDLGEPQEGIHCVQWMVEMALDGAIGFPEDFSFTVHSKNNIAADRIQNYLNNYLQREE